VRAGAKLEAKDQAGETPLHVAAQEGCVEAAAMLAHAGAQINPKDKKGYTPLKRAQLYEQTATAQLLRSLGGQE
jgi:ankyrin repeat protein